MKKLLPNSVIALRANSNSKLITKLNGKNAEN